MALFFFGRAVYWISHMPSAAAIVSDEPGLSALKKELVSTISNSECAFFMTMLRDLLCGHEHYREEDLLRQLFQGLHLWNSSDLLNRLSSERLEMQDALAHYIIFFRNLYATPCQAFSEPGDFIVALIDHLNELQLFLPQPLLEQVGFISFYASYEKWTSEEGIIAWKSQASRYRAPQLKEQWNSFFSYFPLSIRTSDYHQDKTERFFQSLSPFNPLKMDADPAGRRIVYLNEGD